MVDGGSERVEQVDGDRLWSRLMDMAEIGATANGGSNRQALSDEDAAGRALFVHWAEAAGCTAETDRIGNLWVRRPGTDPEADPVLIGSHLDTQPTGGRFDGVYGVLGGLEVIERLDDLGASTTRPIDLVVWTNEEGSRFQYSMMGSAVWSQKLELEGALALADADGLTVADELDRLGWAGTRPAAPTGAAAAFELHIEQGPILEDERIDIGVVTGVQGLRWYTIELEGFPAHAGPTPMAGRRDPARAIAAIVDGSTSWWRPTGSGPGGPSPSSGRPRSRPTRSPRRSPAPSTSGTPRPTSWRGWRSRCAGSWPRPQRNWG